MNLRLHGFFCWFLLLALSGCRSDGPRFDPRQSGFESVGKASHSGQGHKLFKLEAKAFSPVETTNQVNQEWLKPPGDFFRLGPGDLFEIETIGEPNSRATAIVGPDGKIYYGLLSGTFVWGLTLSETKDLIDKDLAKYVRVKPEVALTLKGVGSRQVWMLGSVQTPGVYPLATPITLLEAISAAGGPVSMGGSSDEGADLQNSFVLRRGQLLPVDIYRLLRKGDLSQNIFLQPDDFVYLRSSVAKNVYVFGAVLQPAVVGHTDSLSLLAAVSAAGGTVDYAYLSQIAIIRGSLTQPRIATVDYKKILTGQAVDVRLEPGDIVYIPFVPWRKLSVLADQILRQFVNTVALNEGTRAVTRNAQPIGVSVPGGGLRIGP